MADKPIDEKDIFNSARQITAPEERLKYLQKACGQDPAAMQRVLELLRVYEQEKSFLESSPLAPIGTVDQPVTERAVATIGPYKLVEKIGEGGMGTVYMAQQTEPVKRLVALKLINPGMDSKQVLARFNAERQALALMDHPNIAKVFDAGTTKGESGGVSLGRPYFVMELVKGAPLTKYCDDHRLTPKQRLELFIPVCRAIQHAHQKGIIHRDIKPSNVLVAQYDGKPVPKVIDFGIAKATGQQLTDRTLVTGFGNIVGTLEYMSPEQAEVNQLDIDTRSDIYSLGVLLYELLTGTTPLDKKRLKEAAFAEILRVIREEEPQKPSTRLSNSTDSLSSVSAQRQMEPAKLTKLVRGELDWIVMKALEKDRNRRYETANGFAMDIQRYLADEPVAAGPPSAWYRFRKFARRKRAALAMAICVFVALGSMAGGVGWVARDRAASEEAGARQAQEALTAARTFFGENRLDLARRKLAEARALLGAHHVVPGSLAGEIERLEAELVRFEQFFTWIDQAHQAEIPSPTEVALADQGTGGTVAVLSRKPGQEREPAKAVPFLRKALVLYETMGQKDWSAALEPAALGRDQVEQIRRAVYEELLWLGDDILVRREDHVSGKLLSAAAAAWQALAYLEKAAAAHQPTTAYFSLRARCRGALGDKEAADADAQLARATLPTLALDHFLLGQAALDTKDKDDAVRAFEEALRLEPTHYWSLMRLGQSFTDLGEGPADFEAAVAVYTGCIMKRPDYAPAYRYRARALAKLKQHEKSVQDLSKAIELDPREALAWSTRGAAYNELHQYDKGLGDLNKAIDLEPRIASAWSSRGWAYIGLHQYEKALANLNNAVELDPNRASTWNNRGVAYHNLHQYEKALADLNKAIELDPKLAFAWCNRGKAYNDLHQYEKALVDLNKAIELDPKYANAWSNRGALCCGPLAQFDKALADLNKAIELDPKLAPAWSSRGVAYACLHQYEKALAEYNKAIELNPKDAAIWSNRGAFYCDRLAQYEKALADFNQAIELEPRMAMAWRNRGAAYIRLHQFDKALADLNKAIELDPTLATAWSNRGAAYVNLRQYDKALADSTKAIELNPWIAKAWNARGSIYIDLHQYEKALADLNKAIDLDPKLAWAWNGRGVAYIHLHQYDRALADFSKAIDLDPKNAAAWSNRGANYCDHLAQYEKALADFNKAIELDAKNAVAWRNRGVAYIHLHQYDKALSNLDKAIELNPKDAAAWRNRGWAYDDIRRYDKAIADSTKAIELNPKDAAAWHNRGTSYNHLLQYDKALADLRKATELDPKNALAWNNRGWAYKELHQYDKAIADFSKATEAEPKTADAWCNLAWLFATCSDKRFRDTEKAVPFAQKAVELAPANGDYWTTLAAAHYRARDWKLAIEALNKSIGLRKGGNSTDWFFLAMAHWQVGEKEKAHQWFDQAVQWMEKNAPQNEELCRFRGEAEELLNIKKN
jgi:tetratricopeptide (TPR) repeat protein